MKRLISMILVLLMLCSLAACATGKAPEAQSAAEEPTEKTGEPKVAADDEEVYVATMQLTVPEGSADGVDEVIAYLEEASGGRLQFNVYYNNSLVGKADVIDSLKNGTLDITAFMPAEFPGQFPLNGTLIGIPFLGFPDEQSASEIYYSLTTEDDNFMAEFDNAGIKMWSNYVCPAYQLYLAKDYVPQAEPDFKGLTIMTENSYMQDMIGQYGGAAIFAIPPDFYSNLSNGVADGLIQHINCVNSMSCIELTKTAVFFGDGGICSYPLVYAISYDFWNSLPSDLQELMESVSEDLCQKSVDSDIAQAEPLLQELEDTANVIHLTDEEIAGWKNAFENELEDALDSMESSCPNVREAYNTLVERIETYPAK